MKKTNSFFLTRSMFAYAILAGAFLLFGVNDMNAQVKSYRGTNENPRAAIAQKFGVIAYPMGTFDRVEAIDVLQQNIESIRPQMSSNPSLSVRMKFEYWRNMLKDITYLNIAAEITLITSLSETSSKVGGTPAQLAGMYNQIVSQLQ